MQTVVATKATQDNALMTNLASKSSPECPPKPSADLPARTSVASQSEYPIVRDIEILRIPQITIHVFCDTPSIVGAMERTLADRRMLRANAKRHPGGIFAAIDLYRHSASPNLVIVESRAAVADLYAQLDSLAEVCVSGTKVIVIGYTNDVAIYRELLLRKVSEYAVAPVDPLSMIAIISRLYRDAGANRFGRSLAFIGASGGVGSSTIAQNVASTIARSYSCDVILADLDLPFGTASLGFDLNPTEGIAQALKDSSRFDDMLLERLLTKCEDHLQVLTAPATLEQSYDLEEDAFERVLDVAQTNVSFVVLDVPHIWTSWTKKTLLAADEVVITALPNLASLRNAKSLVELLKQERPNDAPPKLVLNQIGVPKRSEIKPDKFAGALHIEPIACIPFDPSVSTAANNGQMIADVSPKSAVSRSFAKIAETVTGRRRGNSRKNGLGLLSGLWRRS
jgi:pilus assembly protein CpaE